MQHKIFLLSILVAFLAGRMNAQPGPPCPSPPPSGAASCQNTCIYCELDGYTGVNNTAPSGGNSGCPGILLHNDEWYGFSAGSTSITFTLITSNCQNGDGLQAAIWEDCGDLSAIACNIGCGGCGNVPLVLSYDNFTIGETYYLMIDGWVADVCNFEIQITEGSVTPPPPDPAPQPQGPTTVCPGAVAEFTIPDVFAAGNYIWTAPPGSSINGMGSSVNLNAPEGTSVTITFGAQGGNICVSAANSCNPTSASSCIVVANQSTPITQLDSVTICANEFYGFNGDSLTETGVYTAMLTNESGCDSTVILTLTVLPTQEDSLFATICANETFVFNGDTLHASGSYTATFIGLNGCDSTLVLTLTVLPTWGDSLFVTICANETYEFYSDTLSISGVYSELFTAENGCDSTVVLTLTILPTLEDSISATICANETYAFNGDTLNTEGVYTALLTNEYGCDSTVVLTLAILPTSDSSLSATICANETYAFNGDTLSTEGSYTALLTGANGCDSTVVLTLTVLPIQEINLSATICANETYEFYGDTLSESGDYSVLFTAENGCDSTVVLMLTVLPTLESSLQAAICTGETYVFNGETLSAEGIYTALLTNVNGCDSTVVLSLSVNDAPQVNLDDAICAGEIYLFNGEQLTVEGVYVAFLQTSAGCDSTVILSLSVNTAITGLSVQGNTITAEAADAGYQWINCDTGEAIADATDQSYTVGITGNYAVEITLNNCVDTSDCVLVQVVSSYEPLSQNDWELQPNPASYQTMVVFSEDTQTELLLEIHDVAGRRIYSRIVNPGSRQVALELDALPDGMLMVRLLSERGVSTKNLMKSGR